MKKIILALIVIITITSCVSKHPKCAAYDYVNPDPMFKINLERNLYK